MNPTTADLFRAEIALLQADNARLRSQPCPYVTGTVTKHCTLTQLTLTDEEREAVKSAIWDYEQNDDDDGCASMVATLRGLLERLK